LRKGGHFNWDGLGNQKGKGVESGPEVSISDGMGGGGKWTGCRATKTHKRGKGGEETIGMKKLRPACSGGGAHHGKEELRQAAAKLESGFVC